MPTSTTAKPTSPGMNVAEEIAVCEEALNCIEERRQWPRESPPVFVALRTMAGADIPSRPVDNISEGGVRLTTPIGFGVAVGQRYEVALQRAGSDGIPSEIVGEGHYGTVVRTEMTVRGETREDCVGIGLCFDTPIVL